jgi:hypothetical protein
MNHELAKLLSNVTSSVRTAPPPPPVANESYFYTIAPEEEDLPGFQARGKSPTFHGRKHDAEALMTPTPPHITNRTGIAHELSRLVHKVTGEYHPLEKPAPENHTIVIAAAPPEDNSTEEYNVRAVDTSGLTVHQHHSEWNTSIPGPANLKGIDPILDELQRLADLRGLNMTAAATPAPTPDRVDHLNNMTAILKHTDNLRDKMYGKPNGATWNGTHWVEPPFHVNGTGQRHLNDSEVNVHMPHLHVEPAPSERHETFAGHLATLSGFEGLLHAMGKLKEEITGEEPAEFPKGKWGMDQGALNGSAQLREHLRANLTDNVTEEQGINWTWSNATKVEDLRKVDLVPSPLPQKSLFQRFIGEFTGA